MRDSKFGAVLSELLRVLDPAYGGAIVSGERKMARNLVNGLRLPLETGAQDDGDGRAALLAGSQLLKGLDEPTAIDAVLEAARQFHDTLGEGHRIDVAKEIGDQRTIARPPCGGGQRPTRNRRDQKRPGAIWRSRVQGKTHPENRA